jgi:hypothetical protein
VPVAGGHGDVGLTGAAEHRAAAPVSKRQDQIRRRAAEFFGLNEQ